jgi:hypothetical protein
MNNSDEASKWNEMANVKWKMASNDVRITIDQMAKLHRNMVFSLQGRPQARYSPHSMQSNATTLRCDSNIESNQNFIVLTCESRHSIKTEILQARQKQRWNFEMEWDGECEMKDWIATMFESPLMRWHNCIGTWCFPYKGGPRLGIHHILCKATPPALRRDSIIESHPNLIVSWCEYKKWTEIAMLLQRRKQWWSFKMEWDGECEMKHWIAWKIG